MNARLQGRPRDPCGLQSGPPGQPSCDIDMAAGRVGQQRRAQMENGHGDVLGRAGTAEQHALALRLHTQWTKHTNVIAACGCFTP